jgi:hypothetical protein
MKTHKKMDIISPIDFALRQTDYYNNNSFTLEVYRPHTNVFGYTKFSKVDQTSCALNKRELKKLADFIYKFIGEK